MLFPLFFVECKFFPDCSPALPSEHLFSTLRIHNVFDCLTIYSKRRGFCVLVPLFPVKAVIL